MSQIGFRVEFPVSGEDHKLDKASKKEDRKYAMSHHIRGRESDATPKKVSCPAYIRDLTNVID